MHNWYVEEVANRRMRYERVLPLFMVDNSVFAL